MRIENDFGKITYFHLISSNRIIAGVRNIEKAKHVFKDYSDLAYTHFDFEHFDKVTSMINETIENPIRYRNGKRNDYRYGFTSFFTQISDFYEQLTGKKPTDLKTFIDQTATFETVFQNAIKSFVLQVKYKSFPISANAKVQGDLYSTLL